MKSLGLVVEYNPFHNGHLFHLQQAKKTSNADVTVAVMSGNFLQRGEPALVSKWTRTRMALEAGVDLVVELPYAFATQRADRFAYGAITILNALKTDEVIFGSESGNIRPFNETVDFLNKNEEEYNLLIQEKVKSGVSYPSATSEAFKQLSNRPQETIDLSKPNNILGYHYVQSIRQIHSNMKANTIQRTGAGYHDEGVGVNNIASATGIRKMLFEHGSDLSAITSYVPKSTLNRLQDHFNSFGHFLNWDRFFLLLKHRLITSTPEELRDIYDCEEGLENRLKEYITQAEDFTSFMQSVKTKRYTWTRIQRLCTHILTNAKKNTMERALTEPPTYIRLLGMTETGQHYLSGIKKDLNLPLVSTLSKYKDPFFELDKQSTNTYILGFPYKAQKVLYKQEYSNTPIRLHQK
ncbi:nucleotidyltransferase [Pseudalkalibacillus berkeleyi]|uniref:tRNA(Met) cytidine acetate ligase n=1 Tax=Pseudalkalibacillus berkeleyi TaxID=1069813 RepID=A0ABS9GW01_9BACL|nr:nucleotidyltransferase [Pseudalkalibacillus berkeleyi]MCF6136993.1 nucleotidyltransferase [Pseudalkalibacillus berkeleyi]